MSRRNAYIQERWHDRKGRLLLNWILTLNTYLVPRTLVDKTSGLLVKHACALITFTTHWSVFLKNNWCNRQCNWFFDCFHVTWQKLAHMHASFLSKSAKLTSFWIPSRKGAELSVRKLRPHILIRDTEVLRRPLDLVCTHVHTTWSQQN